MGANTKMHHPQISNKIFLTDTTHAHLDIYLRILESFCPPNLLSFPVKEPINFHLYLHNGSKETALSVTSIIGQIANCETPMVGFLSFLVC